MVDRRDRHLRLARRAGPAASPPQAGSRRRVTSTPTATISPPAGCAFPLPSKSSVQLLPCATIFTDSETVHHASVSMRFMRTPNAHRCISQRRPNRRAPVAKKKRSAGDADDNRTALYAQPTARFTELGMSVSPRIFIQLRKYNGHRGTSHLGHSTKSLRSSPLRGSRAERPVAG